VCGACVYVCVYVFVWCVQAVGTFNGMLRIYRPSGRDFKPQDLQLEQQMGAPILQLGIGYFSSHTSTEVQLAVLHPKRLCVYGLTSVSGDAASGGGFYQLSLLYKHNLGRSAYNFTYGPFGKAQGKDYIAIQSLDGELLVIEQERIAFSKFLPNFLVPGPICYAPAPVDGFVTVNSQFEVELFRYGSLSTSSGGEIAQESDKDKEGKRAKPDWTTTLGESAYSVIVARHTQNLQGQGIFDIIVLGEHTIFWLDKAGVVKQQKRLDFFPTCIHAYPVKDAERHPTGWLSPQQLTSHLFRCSMQLLTFAHHMLHLV
jgi:Bardet-Biedl syndrome 9 protein